MQLLEEYIPLTGCTNSHGELCFTSVKNQISGHIKNLRILDELQRLIFQEGGIRDAKGLKGFLIDSFPTFRGDVQHDAGDAYLSIIECLPNLESKCRLTIRKTRSCTECGKTETKDEKEEWCLMLNYDERVLRPLQVAVDEWCNTTSRLIKNCDCKYLNHPHNSNSDLDFY